MQDSRIEVWSFYPGDPDLFSPAEVTALHAAVGIGKKTTDISEAYSLLTEESGLIASNADRPFFSMSLTVGGSPEQNDRLSALIEERVEELPRDEDV